MSVGKDSRFNYAAIMRVEDSAGFLLEPEHLDIRYALIDIVHPDNRQYTPSDTDTWSRISWRHLGHGRHWWIIADHSQIVDPFTELRSPEKAEYVSQLSANLVASTTITSFTIARPTKVRRGDNLRIEDLDIANPVSVDVAVLSVNETTGVVQCSPVEVPVGGIPYALSRVSRIYRDQVRVTIPSANRAFFDSLNFGNPMNTLVD